MTVGKLIKELQKFDPKTKVGTFASDKFDFTFTPISEVYREENVELDEEFRGRGKRAIEDWIIIVGAHQTWKTMHPSLRSDKLQG